MTQTVAENKQVIRLRGIREGLLITLGTGSMDEVVRQLENELAAKRQFLQGSRVALAVGDRRMESQELAEIEALIADSGLELWAVLSDRQATREAAREIGLATRLPGSNTDLDGNLLPQAERDNNRQNQQTIHSPGGLLLRETIRSGRSVYHEGHIVVIGDVNPGAEIIGGGDVVVWGKLRGLVHAGALGDQSAVICALQLTPTQLRIADQIAIAPADSQRRAVPEKAAIRQGQIVAQAWQTRSEG